MSRSWYDLGLVTYGLALICRPELKESLHGETTPQTEESQPRSSPGQFQGAQEQASRDEDLIWLDGETLKNKDLIVDLSAMDLNQTFADIEEIRKYNPQRHEMEQLTAIVYVDRSQEICLGYKDISDQEFWVRGHMPGMPLMPGVMMCEAAAQLSSFYTQRFGLLGCAMVGFGGMEDVRFRDPVFPGQRFYVACQLLRVRRGAMIICRFQGYVNQKIVVDGKIKGVPLPVEALHQLKQR